MDRADRLDSRLVAILVVAVVVLMATSFARGGPALRGTEPIVFVGEGYRVEYPAGWVVERSADSYDPDAIVTIEPVDADALIRLQFFAETADSGRCVETTVAGLELIEQLELRPIERWGRFRGAGYTGSGLIEGKEFRLTLFCRSDRHPPFEIIQVVEAAAVERTRSGFELIRESLRLSETELRAGD